MIIDSVVYDILLLSNGVALPFLHFVLSTTFLPSFQFLRLVLSLILSFNCTALLLAIDNIKVLGPVISSKPAGVMGTKRKTEDVMYRRNRLPLQLSLGLERMEVPSSDPGNRERPRTLSIGFYVLDACDNVLSCR